MVREQGNYIQYVYRYPSSQVLSQAGLETRPVVRQPSTRLTLYTNVQGMIKSCYFNPRLSLLQPTGIRNDSDYFKSGWYRQLLGRAAAAGQAHALSGSQLEALFSRLQRHHQVCVSPNCQRFKFSPRAGTP